jgi:hypothetical protein
MTIEKKLIGQTEFVDFPELHLENVVARVDTGAQTSAVWASNIRLQEGVLRFTLFDDTSEYYTGEVLKTRAHHIRKIVSSNGNKEERQVVKLLILVSGRSIRASFSLANRSSQKYPVLVGRNVLRGKFLVDVEYDHELMTPEKPFKQTANHLII